MTSAFALATLYGAMLELFQAFSGSRNASLADMLYNAAGALVGCAIWLAMSAAVEKIRARRIKSNCEGDVPRSGSKENRKEGAEVVI